LSSASEHRKDLIEVCRLAYQRGYLCGTEGNLSIRISERTILSTASATCKGRIEDADLLICDQEGNLIPSSSQRNGARLSTELKMHLRAYSERPDIFAIVHAHPVTAVGFTVAGKSLEQAVLPEVVCTMGSIPTAPYATPSTDEVPDSIGELARTHDAILLDHHGAITFGADIWSAFYKMETLEHFAKTIMVAELLGGTQALPKQRVEQLLSIRSVYGLTRPVIVKE
jgi:L-fuculose-phosphate aldolase